MFWTRLASGIVLLLIAVVAMSLGGLPLLLVLWGISMIAFRELTKALKCANDDKKLNGLEILGLVGITCYYATIYFAEGHTLQLMCVVGTFLAMMFVYVGTFPKFNANQVVAATFAYLYAPVLLSFVYQTRMCPNGIYMVWMILISSWGCDTCAYAVGMLIGKHKIFPVLSPKKSLEGCIGGVLGSGFIGWLYGYFFVNSVYPETNVAWMIALICAVGAVMSMVGDLAASAIKRNHEIKDYGTLIPGHGGIMDRFDSMIVTAPMTYFLTVLMLVR